MSISRNPCRYCVASLEHKNRHYKGFTIECQVCQYRKEYESYLESKRMFTEGKPIRTLEELMKETWVMFHGHTKHIETIRSMTIRTVEMFLKNGAFKKAIRKETGDGE